MKKNTPMKQALLELGLLVCSCLFLLSSCTPKAEPKTVSFYTDNPAERDKVIAACKDNPGKLKDEPDCINANDSAIQGWGKAKLPPVDFSAAKPASGASK